MSVLRGILLDEQQRLERLVLLYANEIDQLPKGSLQKKKRGEHQYVYRVFRDEEGQQQWEYVGEQDAPAVLEMAEKMARKRLRVTQLKETNEYLAELKIALKYVGKRHRVQPST